MRIPREFIRTLVERADVADIVGERVQLKRRGNNWFGLCPFHTEKTPSFSVNPERGFYHCFGCGAHGTALDFIVKTECAGDFIAGVETLAKRMGMDIPREGGGGNFANPMELHIPSENEESDSDKRMRGNMSALLQAALGRWRRLLSETPKAQEYLKERGMTNETAARFSLGYAEDDWRGLEGFLKLPNYNSEAAFHAGLVRVKEDGSRYDYFRGRLMFPIMLAPDQVIGFGGRTIVGDKAKYINSPESLLFDKGQHLFGLPQASDAVRQRKRLIVCEGYMDVVMLSQAGFRESVATMGTAATAPQMEKAAAKADNVIFAFDGDDAGRAAAWRALEGILPVLEDGKSVSFLFLPAGEDPDSFIQKHGAESFETLLTNAKSLGEYAAERLLENTGAGRDEKQRIAAVNPALALLAKVNEERAKFLRDILARTLAERIGLDPSRLTREAAERADLERERTRPPEKMDARRRGNFQMPPESPLLSLLCCLHARPELGLGLEESPPLLGSTGGREAVEAVEVVLSRLRFRGGDSGEAEEGEEQEGGGMNVAQWLEEEGFSGVAQQVRQSRRFVEWKEERPEEGEEENPEKKAEEKIAQASPEGDFHQVLRSLQRLHLKRTGEGKTAWLEKIRGEMEEDYEIPPLDGN